MKDVVRLVRAVLFWKNAFCNLDKYILYFVKIHCLIQTNTFGKGGNERCGEVGGGDISLIKVHFAIRTNTV